MTTRTFACPQMGKSGRSAQEADETGKRSSEQQRVDRRTGPEPAGFILAAGAPIKPDRHRSGSEPVHERAGESSYSDQGEPVHLGSLEQASTSATGRKRTFNPASRISIWLTPDTCFSYIPNLR